MERLRCGVGNGNRQIPSSLCQNFHLVSSHQTSARARTALHVNTLVQEAASHPMKCKAYSAIVSCCRHSSRSPRPAQASSSSHPHRTSISSPNGSLSTSTHVRSSSHGKRDSIISHSSAGGQGTGDIKPPPSLTQRVLKFVNAQVLPLLLLTAMLVGFCSPSMGAAAAKTSLSTYTTTAVFVLAGLSIKRGEALEAFKYSGKSQASLFAEESCWVACLVSRVNHRHAA